MTLKAITTTPQRTAALLRIYRGKVVLSARTLAILSVIPTRPYVRIRTDEDGGSLYIGSGSSADGYRVSMRGHVGQINSHDLSVTLAGLLDGYGTYRILEDRYTFQDGQINYMIQPVNWTRK